MNDLAKIEYFFGATDERNEYIYSHKRSFTIFFMLVSTASNFYSRNMSLGEILYRVVNLRAVYPSYFLYHARTPSLIKHKFPKHHLTR